MAYLGKLTPEQMAEWLKDHPFGRTSIHIGVKRPIVQQPAPKSYAHWNPMTPLSGDEAQIDPEAPAEVPKEERKGRA